jgi:hypothetical protein
MKPAMLALAATLAALTAGSANAGQAEGTRWNTWSPFMQSPDCELKLVDVFQRAPDQAIYFKIKNMSKNRVSYHFGATVLRAGHVVASPTVFAEGVSPGETRDSQSMPIKGSLKGTIITPRVDSCGVLRAK